MLLTTEPLKFDMTAAHLALACPLCAFSPSVFFFQDDKNYRQRYQHCPQCDVVFVDPACRLDAAAEKARYDKHNNDNSTPYVQFLSRLALPVLAQLSSPAVGLDFGSGRSQAMAEIFRQAGHRCDCYDIFFYPKTTLLPQAYDFMIASEVIEHLYSPKAVIEQWLTLLKPGGLLGIMTGIRPAAATDFADWWYKNDPTHVLLLSDKTFAYLQRRYALTPLFAEKGVFVFRLPQ